MEFFVLRSKKDIDEYVGWLKSQFLPLKVLTQFIDRERTLDQNSYLFGVVYKYISDYTGDSIPKVHQDYTDEHNVDYSFNPRTQEFELRVRSTTEFMVMDMSDYIDKVCADAHDRLGIRIPEANECFDNEELKFDVHRDSKQKANR
jgi:hypothetical protein